MAIKIDGQDLLKKFIGWQEIVRIYKNGGEIRPNTVPPVFDDYLCFTAEESNSTIRLISEFWTLTINTLETSTDWNTWNPYILWDTIILANIGDKLYRRNTSTTNTTFSTEQDYYRFFMTWSIAWSWDVTSLINRNWTNTLSDSCFLSLFSYCASLTSCPILSATNLAIDCYRGMFQWCSALTTPPLLPATTLTYGCYRGMFYNCASLTSCPVLPATTLRERCYDGMFHWCSSLTTPPQLPATNLYEYCYGDMFSNCTSLNVLPQLPATSLAYACYYRMFRWCAGIKISTSQTWEYQIPYRIPTNWEWSMLSRSLENMFTDTWWTFTGTPNINQTYYTSNRVI